MKQMVMKQLALALAIFAAGVASAVTTWQVNQQTGDDTAAAADKTGATPFKHLQVAVSNAKAGDTVVVGPGVYDGAWEGEPLEDTTNGKARLKIPLCMTVKSSDGAGVTVIEGAFDATDSKLGPNAVRCVTIVKPGTVVEGFTLRNGATAADDSAKMGRGGAVYTLGSAENRLNMYVIDCLITNCVSYNSAVFFGTLYRSRIVDCTATGLYAAQVSGRAWFSSFIGNHSANGASAGMSFVNCTFVANEKYDTVASKNYLTSVTNCVSVMSSGLQNENDYLFADANVTPKSSDPNALIAPLFGDLRVRMDGPADAWALESALDAISLPDGYTLTDIEKQPIDRSHLQLGAYQTRAEAAAGGVSFVANVEVDGVVAPYASAVYPLSYPIQYRVRGVSTSDSPVFGYKMSGYTSQWRFPGMNDDYIAVMPSPEIGALSAVSFVTADSTLWVDRSEGNDDTGAGTDKSPYASIQKAVAELPSTGYTIIRVRKGVYDNGTCDYIYNSSSVAQTNYGKSRVNLWSKKVRILAVDGPDETSIVGENNETDGGRCLMMQGSSGTCVQGFTLTGGHTAKTSTALAGCGGAYYCIGVNCCIYDCVITGNAGARSLAGTGGLAVRCRFKDNTWIETDDVTSPCVVGLNTDTIMIGCVLDNACAQGGVLGGYSVPVNCTIIGDPTTDYLISNDKTIKSICTIFEGSKRAQLKPLQQECIFWNFGTIDDAVQGYTLGNPYLIDPANDDFRVLLNSPAFTAAAVPTAENYGTNYYEYVVTDADGALHPFANGRPCLGAYSERVPGVVISAANGGLTVVGGKVGVNALDAESTITISGATTALRPCVGVTTNGVACRFDDLPSGTITIDGGTENQVVDIAAIYTTDWYVNCDTDVGSDEHSGFTPKTALRTAGAALERAIAGDTVHLADGTYDASTAPAMPFSITYTNAPYASYARLAIPAGITVRGASREGTVIEGAAATVGSVGYDEKTGCGADAVRGVALLGAGATIADVTIRNGRTTIYGDTNSDKKSNLANFGGGVCYVTTSPDANAVNCIIENCAAYRGGGVACAKGINCIVRGNQAVDAAAGSYYGAYYGCVFTGHTATLFVVEYPRVLRNCTVARNTTISSREAAHVYIVADKFEMINTLVAGSSYSKCAGTISHCALANDSTLPQFIDPALTDGSCVYATLAELETDADGRPTIGANAGIDKADEDEYDADLCGDQDPTGIQRVMNGAMDIGALEADYRPVYQQAINLKRGAVTEVTRDVALDSDGNVRLADGDALKATWQHVGATTCRIAVTMTGDGVLVIKRNGEILSQLTETGEVSFEGSAATDDGLEIAYTGLGSATFALSDVVGLRIMFY